MTKIWFHRSIMMLAITAVFALSLLLGGCATYTIAEPGQADTPETRLATCYVDAFNAFCRVATPPNTSAVSGVGGSMSVGTVLYGAGNVLIGARAP